MKLFQDETRTLTLRTLSHAHHALLDNTASYARPGSTLIHFIFMHISSDSPEDERYWLVAKV